MGVLVGLAFAAACVSWIRAWGSPRDPTSWVTGAALVSLASGALIALLGCLGAVSVPVIAAVELALLAAGLAVAPSLARRPPAGIPRSERTAIPARAHRRWLWALGGVLLLGLALHLPPRAAPLGGRDAGSHALRARHLLREGGHELRDPLLAALGERSPTLPAVADLQSLYPIDDDPARRGLYEGAYRPGFYLADRREGRVVPQFFHLHASVLALFGAIFGPARVHWAAPWLAGLASLAFALLAWRRLAPPWALVATALVCLDPLTIWTTRLPLSESTYALTLMLAALAADRAVASGEAPRAAASPTKAPGSSRPWLAVAAFALAMATWTRGEGWIFAPVVLGLAWFRPTAWRGRFDGARLFALLFVMGVLLHLWTSYPYVHDEVLRRLPPRWVPGPTAASVATVAGLVAWLAADRWVFARRADPNAFPKNAFPKWLEPIPLAACLSLIALACLRGFGSDPGTGFESRLDPGWVVLGPVGLGFAAFGAAITLVRDRPGPPATTLAARGLAWTLVACTGWLYWPRNLPDAHLYYYGRYWVPLLLPAVAWLSARGLAAIAGPPEGLRLRRGLAGALAFGLLALRSQPWFNSPLWAVDPGQRVEPATQWLADQLPAPSIVIAGGEGWHSGFTFQQVAANLALAHGHIVLPYRDRESAYATATALLRPEGEALRGGRRVFLLVNEASHHYTRPDLDPAADATGAIRAGADDLLSAPLRIADERGFELWRDRLTPSEVELPSRVTRDGYRMSLIELAWPEPAIAAAEERRLAFTDALPSGVAHRGGELRWASGGGLCLPRAKEGLQLELPPDFAVPGELVVVLGPESAIANHGIELHLDRARLPITAGLGEPPVRATLGPFTRPEGSRRLRLRGFPGARPELECPHGRLLEVRGLALPLGVRELGEPIAAASFAAPRDFGHPHKRSAWVRARAVTAFRPLTRAGRPHDESKPPRSAREFAWGLPAPTAGLSIRVQGDAVVEFGPEYLPRAPEERYDLVVSLTKARLSEPNARLILEIDALDGDPALREVIEVPATLDRSWQAPKISRRWSAGRVRGRIYLQGAGTDDHVDVRDLAWFARSPTLVPETPTP